jgi:hypothetical protein
MKQNIKIDLLAFAETLHSAREEVMHKGDHPPAPPHTSPVPGVNEETAPGVVNEQ